MAVEIPSRSSGQPPNNAFERTVRGQRVRGASALVYCAPAPRASLRRAAAQRER